MLDAGSAQVTTQSSVHVVLARDADVTHSMLKTKQGITGVWRTGDVFV